MGPGQGSQWLDNLGRLMREEEAAMDEEEAAVDEGRSRQ